MKSYECDKCGKQLGVDNHELLIQDDQLVCRDCLDETRESVKITPGSKRDMLFDCN